MSLDELRACFGPVVREVFVVEDELGVANAYRQLAAWGFPGALGWLVGTTHEGTVVGTVAMLVGLAGVFGTAFAGSVFIGAVSTRWATREYRDDGPETVALAGRDNRTESDLYQPADE